MTMGSFLSSLFHKETKRGPESEPQLKQAVERAATIVAEYGEVLSDNRQRGLVQDEKRLPSSKEQIKAAVRVLLRVTKDPAMREHLKTGYVALSWYQPLTAVQKHALGQWDSTVGHEGSVGDSDLQKMAQAITESGEVVQNLHRMVAAEMDTLLLEFNAEANRSS